jgi:L-alanine-DL-glutamate epimerase-like enolase superfamily enzyme
MDGVKLKIEAATVLEFRRGLDGRSWNPAFRWTEKRAPLLRIQADSGLTGIGEAWSRYVASEAVISHLSDTVAPSLLGQTINDNESVFTAVQRLSAPSEDSWIAAAASSAVEIALWDLVTKHRGVSVWQALGGHSRAVPVYASGGLYRDGATLDDLALEMRGYVDSGYRAVKMKVGGLPLQQDLDRVGVVRGAVGEGTVLWVDAVNQLSRREAWTWCESLAERGVTAIQSPLADDDVEGTASLNKGVLPVIACEAEFRQDVFQQLVDLGAVTYLQFCAGLVGGFTGSLRLDALARRNGISTTPTCYSTAILQAATLHLAAASGNVVYAEVHQYHDHLASLLPQEMRAVVNGQMHLSATPGLGLSPFCIGSQSDGGEISVRGDHGGHRFAAESCASGT